MISGQFCECDNFSCDRHKGILCSGPDHGECECGKCVCIPPWSGTSCSCRASNDTCYPPNMEDAELCSGHGKCVCGQCECFTNDNARYSGKYCEKCPVSTSFHKIYTKWDKHYSTTYHDLLVVSAC